MFCWSWSFLLKGFLVVPSETLRSAFKCRSTFLTYFKSSEVTKSQWLWEFISISRMLKVTFHVFFFSYTITLIGICIFPPLCDLKETYYQIRFVQDHFFVFICLGLFVFSLYSKNHGISIYSVAYFYRVILDIFFRGLSYSC